MRDGVLEMTSDHTYVNEMVAMGKLTGGECKHPKRHILDKHSVIRNMSAGNPAFRSETRGSTVARYRRIARFPSFKAIEKRSKR